MGVNHFSKEQIDELSKNPYVQRVTEKAITYTEQFREEFYLKYNHGDTPASILRSMGFNTKVLGQKRINGIVQRIKKMAEKGYTNKKTKDIISSTSCFVEGTTCSHICCCRRHSTVKRNNFRNHC